MKITFNENDQIEFHNPEPPQATQAPEMIQNVQVVEPKRIIPEIVYDHMSRLYLVENDDKQWMKINEQSLKMRLKAWGIPKNRFGQAIITIQQSKCVNYAGPLAGYKTGIYDIHGNRILVTTSPKIIRAVPGDWPVLHQILTTLLGDQQFVYFCGWMKSALACLHSGKFRPGQVLILVGPRKCGKSLLQNVVITPLLGGRIAKPFQYMMGDSKFNGELVEGEHLMIEDEFRTATHTNRKRFAESIKEIAANRAHLCHIKYKTPITLTPFWRATISLNDEPENLRILPTLDDSMTDKLLLFKTDRAKIPMPTGTVEEEELFAERLRQELPHFVHFLQEFVIPLELQSDRFEITHFHHPDVLTAIDEMASELGLLEIIDLVLFKSPGEQPWIGTAAELETILRMSSQEEAVKGYLNFNNAAGTFLGKIARLRPHRVQYGRTDSTRFWTIHPPQSPQ
jgi:hypothetical protein